MRVGFTYDRLRFIPVSRFVSSTPCRIYSAGLTYSYFGNNPTCQQCGSYLKNICKEIFLNDLKSFGSLEENQLIEDISYKKKNSLFWYPSLLKLICDNNLEKIETNRDFEVEILNRLEWLLQNLNLLNLKFKDLLLIYNL